jgi:hypothetical protein
MSISMTFRACLLADIKGSKKGVEGGNMHHLVHLLKLLIWGAEIPKPILHIPLRRIGETIFMN